MAHTNKTEDKEHALFLTLYNFSNNISLNVFLLSEKEYSVLIKILIKILQDKNLFKISQY